MDRDWIDELISKLNIVDVVSKYVPLNRKGRTYWGCCPFHHEKDPSFAVNEDKQFYHCFGCKESGHLSRASKEDAGSIVGGQATCLASPFYRTTCRF